MKKKSILTLIFSICFIVPAMFMLTACGHNHKAVAEWSIDDTYHWHVCEGENCEEQLDKAEHTWGEWAIATESTCSENGKEERVCTVCGKKESRTIEVAQHEYTYVYDAQTCTFISPTKETEGKLLLKCNNCDHREQVFIYPVISDENYSSNCSNVNNTGWKFVYTLKNAYYTNNQISNEIKTLTQQQIKIDVESFKDTLGCNLIELLETETDDEMSFSYNFTAPGRYYIAMKDSSTTKAFSSITFTPAIDGATLSSMFVYNESGAEPADDSKETNTFAWQAQYASNMIANKTATFLIVVDVQTAGAGTFTMKVGKATATLSINDLNKVYDGQDIEDVYSTNSTATAVVEYKVQGADDSTYTTEMPYNAGNYTVRVSIPENEIYTEVSATRDFTITKKILSAIELETSSNATAQTITLTAENGIVNGDTVKVDITVNSSQDYEQEGTLNLTTNEPSQGNAQIEFVKDGDYENYDFDTTNIGTITYTTA